MDYRIYPLKDQSRLDELCSLFAKGLADTTPEYWRWKHFSKNGHPESTILVAEAKDGSFAGMFALKPLYYEYDGKRVLVVQPMDLVIDPTYRGSGLMRKLHNYAVAHFTQMGAIGFMEFPNQNSYPILLKYGSKDMQGVFSRNTKKRILPVYLEKREVSYGGWEIVLQNEMPSDLFYPIRQNNLTIEKSEDFMKWRFRDNPDYSYKWLTIRKDGVLHGYLTVHITQGRFRRAVNIYDWILDEQVDAQTLKAAVKLLSSHGNWISLWGKYEQDELDRWAEVGLTEQNLDPTNFLWYVLGNADIPEHWHLTRADLDY